MTMFKNVNGMSVECSPEEESTIIAERQAEAPTLASRVAATLTRIDSDVDTLYAAVIGNRAEEYRVAEAEAIAFKGAGYTGAVPASVASWASAKGWTATAACDDILATASAWRTAQSAIRAARLLRKEQARNAATAQELNTVTASWEGFVAAIRSQLAL